MTRVLKLLVSVVGAGALVAGVLYAFFGLRAELDGAGWPHLVFKMSPEEQAALIERHRASQRAPAPEGTPSVTTSTGVPPASAPAGAVEAVGAEGATTAAAPKDAVPPVASSTAPADALRPTAASSASSSSWPEFRGPRRDGVYRGGPIRTAWPSEGLAPLWKQPIGGGYASFVIMSGRAFTIEQRAHQEVVAAYDVTSGRELWTNAWDGMFQETMGGDGPRATPTWANGTVYALGALGELRALDDATGRVRWRTNILQDAAATNLQWGMSAAPLVVDDAVVVLPGGRSGQSVLAYNRTSGKKVWGALPDQAAYVSPMLVTLGGVRQILVLTADRLVGLSVEAGAVLWSHPWVGPNNGINAAQPIPIGEDRFYLSSGYGLGAAVVEVNGGPNGFTTREVWRNTRMKNRFASAVLHEGVIYGLDESILAAIDAATGEQKWKGGRYGYGQLLLADGHLIVLTEDGDLALVRATPDKHEELARFPVLNGKTWNPPALANGVLLVRNLAEMAAFDLRVKP